MGTTSSRIRRESAKRRTSFRQKLSTQETPAAPAVQVTQASPLPRNANNLRIDQEEVPSVRRVASDHHHPSRTNEKFFMRVGDGTMVPTGVLRVEGHSDSVSLSESEGRTPRSCHRNLMEVKKNSPSLARSKRPSRRGSSLAPRLRDKDRDSDTASLVSSSDDYIGQVFLEPLEHEWMIQASDGEWEMLRNMLEQDPGLVVKKDFVTGFTSLHWAAKQGRTELLALLVNTSRQKGRRVNVNVRSAAGYTPLHLAAMHGHFEVLKLLVGAYDADLEVRDYSGKTASQYLPANSPAGIRDMVGGKGDNTQHTEAPAQRPKRAHLKSFKFLSHSDEDVTNDGKVKTKSTLFKSKTFNKIRPSLKKGRGRSKIVHSMIFRKTEEVEVTARSLIQSRPKSNIVG